jgi:hypothetical protein
MTKTHVSFPFVLLRFWFWRILWLWFLTGFFIFIMQLIICGIARDNEMVGLIINMLERMPGFVKKAVGGGMLEVGNIMSFIAIGYRHPLVLILYMVFAVAVPTGLLTGNVQNGTMELILSRSATKNHVYMCACILTLAGMLALVIFMFAGTAAGVSIYNFGPKVPLWSFFRASIVAGLSSAASAGVALLAAVLFSNRGRAVGVAAGFFIINYFVALVSGWWPRAAFLAPATLFHYADLSAALFGKTWPIYDMCVLFSVLIIAVAAGGIIWNRRDLPL